MPLKKILRVAALAVSACLANGAQASFNINISYSGSWTTAEQSAFTQAETFWESVITGYQPSFMQEAANYNVTPTGINIAATSAYIDGVGNVLGSAGPTTAWFGTTYVVANSGAMNFDSADMTAMVNNGSFAKVVMHEMGHVLGIGTLWTDNGVYVDNSGHYTGANALAAYRSEFNQPGASYVPVELGGGTGTANGHWNEVDGGAGLTGIQDAQGRDMRDEIMTGWLNNTPNAFISRTTKASLIDIGYTVNLSPVPEPGTWVLFAAGVPLLLRRRRLQPGQTSR
jgi:hypothetical protein